ncbi:hypothetical protein GCM10010919_24880 [Alishewanella longhuensis]|uniref:Glycosyltransferase 2-like domain-containing protein n=1 Tax=Alishewanella longhuensis TaxID=1091037 RepID=A0ABQ3L2C5_9ALTE|nr:glycosyltransferase [Alishewanella longhuensis]GHG72518.1 hypothetical protein GCM10010919_24880 [Alishewanella longhuensis]
MDQTIYLSLIIPFYNVGENFKPLLASLEQQLIPGVEAVLICDGATDGSLEVARQHLAESAVPFRYQLIAQTNAGVSAARNKGIAQARGSYIGFVDADDVLLQGYSSTLLDVIKQQQPDLIEMGFKRFSKTEQLATAKSRYLHKKEGLQACHKVALATFKTNRWYPWLRVYRKAMINNFAFPLNVGFCEDLMAIPALYQHAKTLFCIRQPLYGYREHAASATFNVKPEALLALKHFSLAISKGEDYADLPSKWRSVLQFNLAYLLLKMHKTSPGNQQLSPVLTAHLRTMGRRHMLTPGMSLRKKLRLAFPNALYAAKS